MALLHICLDVSTSCAVKIMLQPFVLYSNLLSAFLLSQLTHKKALTKKKSWWLGSNQWVWSGRGYRVLTLHDRSLQFNENTFWLRSVANNNECRSLFLGRGRRVVCSGADTAEGRVEGRGLEICLKLCVPSISAPHYWLQLDSTHTHTHTHTHIHKHTFWL